MINEQSVAAVEAARLDERFIRPLYHDYGFAQIPQTVRRLFGVSGAGGVPFGPREDLYQTYDAVILLFIDAFGWRFFERYADTHPFLKRIVEQGLANKLTSQFPSTTAAHVTTIHTGLTPAQSGVFEWYYYEPQVDAIIAPLLFSYAAQKGRDTLSASGIAPSALYPTATLYQELRAHGVRSHLYHHQQYAFSPYTKTVTKGASPSSFRTLPEAFVNLANAIEQQTERTYYFLYFDAIDSICHNYGPESAQLDAEILVFLDAAERVLHQHLSKTGRKTLLLLTADHGQTALTPKTATYLNTSLPGFERFIKTDRAGRPLVPAGSSRDMFLYIDEEHLDEAEAHVQKLVRGKADVRRVSELITQNFFGSVTPSERFLERVGNLVVLPYHGEAVWWYEQGRYEQRFRGAHGGLTRDEMETLLLALPYGT